MGWARLVELGGGGRDLEEEGVLGREDAAGPDQADPGDDLAREEVLPWARAGWKVIRGPSCGWGRGRGRAAVGDGAVERWGMGVGGAVSWDDGSREEVLRWV